MKDKNGLKINIGLNITEKREDGFHNLESIFYPLEVLSDTVEISASEDFASVEVVNADFDCFPEDNLCMRAYRLLAKNYALPPLHIRLVKNIPSGSGVGGGSANAALTLRLINQYCKLNLNNETLKQFAAQLGSDVPFFVDNKPAYVTGRGDIMQPVDLSLDKYEIKLQFPTVAISTLTAYKMITPHASSFYLPDIKKIPIEEWRYYVKNDFEEVLFPQYPLLRKLKEDFYQQGALYASMSGSGSAIYGIFRK